MAKRTRRTTSRSSGNGVSLNKFAFWIVVIIGIAMLVSGVLNFFDWSWVDAACNWIMNLCFILGMFVPVILSYRVARNKSTAWFILWIILVVFVVFGLVSRVIAMF